METRPQPLSGGGETEKLENSQTDGVIKILMPSNYID